MKSSLKIGSVLGIPIRLHITFLLILPLIAFSFAAGPSPFGFSAISDPIMRYALGTIAGILLFACVLVHEVAHSYVAIRNRIKISDITLYLFGGVSSMEEVPRNPGVEARIAVVGPLTSIAIGIACGALLLVTGIPTTTPLGIMIFLMTYLNILLGIFNILPAFPMDGGRVLRALLAMRMPYIAATRWAVFTGKMFAYLLGIVGLFMGLSGIWFIIIAFFIYVAAGEEERSTITSVMLDGVKVRDIMTKAVDTIDSGASLSSCLQTMFQKKHLGYPVLENGRLAGIVTLSDVSKVPETARDSTFVRDVMTRNVITLKPDDDAADALQKISQRRVGRVVVMEGDRLAGIISRTDIVRAIELQGALSKQ
ncbi:CBS domain-containing protein [Methanocella arvoryzae]|uniref:Zinc metalloprotease n=1 Tax=Methanocella arvoryzae (strain DSM 22066 / NBRC 105507 / MRE50) TaxID=351160 RepID=Q0W6W1_METAR|nr:CBS domain-containing protein [Methanocella arvoryzae]CAJ35882.1 predicted metalloprotease (M50 family) [Methanocella arvoryzae MRE50]